VRFLDVLRRIYASVPFLEALKEAPTYLKFLRELLSKKGEPVEASVAPIGEPYCVILQRRPLSKLQDPSSFSIPCCIWDIQIEKALCDLVASVNLMPLSLCKKLKLLDLMPTAAFIQLADCSTRQPVGILEDILVQVGKFAIPATLSFSTWTRTSSSPSSWGGHSLLLQEL